MRKPRAREGYQFEEELESKGGHKNICFVRKIEKPEPRYVLKEIHSSLRQFYEKELSHLQALEDGEREKRMEAIIEVARNYVQAEFYDGGILAFEAEMCKLTILEDRLWAATLWGNVFFFRKLLAEYFCSRFLYFFLGAPQPENRIVISKDLGLFVASPEVFHKESLGISEVRFYLEKYAANLFYNLILKNTDFHPRQVLLTQDNVVVVVDYEDCVQRNMFSPETKSFVKVPMYNINDIRYLPFVGPNSKRGGSWSPTNWLGSYAYMDDKVSSDFALHCWDLNTFENPRFQQDKHRAMLTFFLSPPELSSKILEKATGKLVAHFEESRLFTLLVKQIEIDLDCEKKLFCMIDAAKIPEFVEYLKNITIFDLSEIAQEFSLRRGYLPESFPQTQAGVFEYCLGKIGNILRGAPFLFKADQMPLALRFISSLSQEDRSYFVRKILDEKCTSAAEFFAAASKNLIDFMAQFSAVDHLFRLGKLDHPVNMGEIKIPEGLDQKAIRARIDWIIKTIKARQLISECMSHFNLRNFNFVLQKIKGLREELPVMLAIPAVAGIDLFLSTDPILFQRLISHYFPNTDAESLCLAQGLLIFMESLRKQAIQNLSAEDYKRLPPLLGIADCAELRKKLCPPSLLDLGDGQGQLDSIFGLRRMTQNRVLLLQHNSNLSHLERATLSLLLEMLHWPGFCRVYKKREEYFFVEELLDVDQNMEIKYFILVLGLVALVFDRDKTRVMLSHNFSDLLFLKYYLSKENLGFRVLASTWRISENLELSDAQKKRIDSLAPLFWEALELFLKDMNIPLTYRLLEEGDMRWARWAGISEEQKWQLELIERLIEEPVLEEIKDLALSNDAEPLCLEIFRKITDTEYRNSVKAELSSLSSQRDRIIEKLSLLERHENMPEKEERKQLSDLFKTPFGKGIQTSSSYTASECKGKEL